MISLFVSLVVLRWSSTTFGGQVVDCFNLLHKCLSASLDAVLDNSGDEPHSDPDDPDRRQNLLNKSIALNTAYAQAAFELRMGRLKGKLPLSVLSTPPIPRSESNQAVYPYGRTSQTRIGMGSF